MNRFAVFAVLAIFCLAAKHIHAESIDDRVEQLLSQMTVEEKVAQLIIDNADYDTLIQRYNQTGFGSTYIFTLNDVNQRNKLQEIIVKNSRLHIPVTFPTEGLHSGTFRGTIFPAPCGMASTWNPDLMEKINEVIALEARVGGADRTFSPNINLYTDPRFGRYEEGWGEDPHLTSVMGVASVKGLQGAVNASGYYSQERIMATSKHFAGYGRNQAGQDGSQADISERTLREMYMKAFLAVIKAGTASIMPGHNEVTMNGLPCHANKYLLTDILRNEYKYTGLVSSDYNDISSMVGYHFVANYEEAAMSALHAGVDMDLGGTAYMTLTKLIKSGQVPMTYVDRSVRKVLYTKFAIGIFENPYTDPNGASILDNPRHRELARVAAVEGTVLLKNSAKVLPLDPSKLKSVAIIGPTSNEPIDQVGGYTLYGANIVTPLQGIQNYIQQYNTDFSAKITTQYAEGCYIMNNSKVLLDDAIAAAKSSDVAVVFVGDSAETCRESWGGRAGDRADLDMSGGQLELIEAVINTGTPTVVVIMGGRPQTFGVETNNTLLNKIDSLLVSFRSGEEGGNALAQILFGKESPSGRLISAWPWSVGQIGGPAQPYWQKYRCYDGLQYTFQPNVPLFYFGYGLTYTQFSYSNMQLSNNFLDLDGTLEVQVTITNTGARDGKEVAQMYIAQDSGASVVRYKKLLHQFQKVFIAAGSSVVVTFTMPVSDLAHYDAKMVYRVEPGTFVVWVGPSSDESQCLYNGFAVKAAADNVKSNNYHWIFDA